MFYYNIKMYNFTNYFLKLNINKNLKDILIKGYKQSLEIVDQQNVNPVKKNYRTLIKYFYLFWGFF